MPLPPVIPPPPPPPLTPPHSAGTKPWGPPGLSSFASSNPSHAPLLGLIDSFRANRLSKYLDLPLIAVCGDQSSGKSSFLSSLTSLSFPRKSTRCTRFATEVVIRRSSEPAVNISIRSHNPEARNRALVTQQDRFRQRLDTISDLSDVVQRAADVMDYSQGGFFTQDVLHIEIGGPDKTELVLVDLPGLVHAGDDEEEVMQLVTKYMQSPRALILAVVSSSSDPELQIVLKKAAEYDPGGRRTLGIITKPDTLPPGSEIEKIFVQLAQNRYRGFRLMDWHVICSGPTRDDEGTVDFAAREAEEKVFFSKPPWTALPRRDVGIQQLRSKLSELLLTHIKRELRGVKKELDDQIKLCKRDLLGLGDYYEDAVAQRKCLNKIGKRFSLLCAEATWGVYEDADFFNTGFDSEYDKRYLRAVIQNYNAQFAKVVWRYGHTIEVEDVPLIPGSSTSDQNSEETARFDGCRTPPQILSRYDAVTTWASPVSRRSRGTEIGDGRNPVLVKLLFTEQAKKWKALAAQQVRDCAEACRTFLNEVLEEVSPVEMQEPLYDWVMRRMDEKLANAMEELQRITHDAFGRPPIINDYQFNRDIDSAREQRLQRLQRRGPDGQESRYAAQTILGQFASEFISKAPIPVEDITDFLTRAMASDQDDHGESNSEETPPEHRRVESSLDEMLAFYKGARTRFVDNVVIQVIERHLVGELRDIFSSAEVAGMTNDEVSGIVEETPAKAAKRRDLKERLAELQEGSANCRKYGR